MSSSYISSLQFAEKQVIIYFGCLIFIGGMLGDILNITVFLSLQTFRQSSCAFYLIIMSIVNIGQLLANVLPRLLGVIIGSDGSETSLFYCKFRLFFTVLCTIISLNCFCLAMIDQYCATCSRPRLQQLCNMKLARRLILIFSVIWTLYALPYYIFFNHIISPTTGKVICTMTNTVYIQFRAYFGSPVVIGFLPIFITVTFGLMAYRNIQQMRYYTVPLIRRELDKQLTLIVLAQGAINTIVLSPYTITIIFALTTNVRDDPILKAQIDFVTDITFTIVWIYYACPFYVYICVSHRFRRQFIHVFSKIHLQHCKEKPNQVMPQT
ncbi:hypothetical protein I4U23_023213 [Adineta vaga]|nr:hypothetical protein I4U23_023213 [Adineta vaga]